MYVLPAQDIHHILGGQVVAYKEKGQRNGWTVPSGVITAPFGKAVPVSFWILSSPFGVTIAMSRSGAACASGLKKLKSIPMYVFPVGDTTASLGKSS